LVENQINYLKKEIEKLEESLQQIINALTHNW